MKRAVIGVKENGMIIKKAAFLHKVNRTTLINHLKGYRCGPVGIPALLTNDEERLIVYTLIKLSKWVFGVDRNAVQCIVKDLQSVSSEHSFQHGKPGID